MKTRSGPARVALLLAAFSLLGPCGAALADGDGEGGEGAEGIQQKVKAQVEKILKLMRENEKALLEASRGSGRKPEGVDVKPPEPPSAMQQDAAPPEGAPPPLKGEDVKKRLEELLKTSQGSGASIPKELEDLVKMIPVMSGQGQGQGPPDPSPGSGSTEPRKTKDLPDPQDGTEPKGAQKPKDPAKGDYEKGAQKPPDGDKSDPAHPEEPSWLVSLPEQIQRMITGGDTESVPQRYRHLVEAYQKWLAEHAKGGTTGR